MPAGARLAANRASPGSHLRLDAHLGAHRRREEAVAVGEVVHLGEPGRRHLACEAGARLQRDAGDGEAAVSAEVSIEPQA